MNKNVFKNFRDEYWFHVSNQNEIPIFGKTTKSIDAQYLYDIAHNLPETGQDAYIKDVIKKDVDSIDALRTIVGITDKRMYLELSYIFNKYRLKKDTDKNILGESVYALKKHGVSFFKSIITNGKDHEKSETALSTITDYLIERGTLQMLNTLKRMDWDETDSLVKNLLLPKEVQQEETKRRGHGAEQELAKLFHQLGVRYIPEDKHENPMGSNDPNVDPKTFKIVERKKNVTWSIDLIVEQKDDPKILIQGLVHTSDPGQYGVNKSDDTVAIKKDLKKYNNTTNEKIELWGLVDGVGFIENPDNTIYKMLEHFDTFVQLKTLYKAALKLHALNMVKIKAIRFDMDFYSKEQADSMFTLYGSSDVQKITDGTISDGREIKAGKAWLYV